MLALVQAGKSPEEFDHPLESELATTTEMIYRSEDILCYGACALLCVDRGRERIIWYRTDWEGKVQATRAGTSDSLVSEFEKDSIYPQTPNQLLRLKIRGRRHDYFLYFHSIDPAEILQNFEIAGVMNS